MALDNVAIQQFRAAFTNEYQQTENVLAGSMQEFRNLVGNAYKIPVAYQAMLQERTSPFSAIPPQITDYVHKIIVPKRYITLLPSDLFLQTEVNANERQNQAKIAANAIARREVQERIDGLDDSTTTNTVAVGTTNLTVDKLREAKYYLDANNVPMMGRHYLGHASQLSSLLNETETTSSDYATVKALVNGDINTFLGFTFHWLGDMDEGGLPKTGDDRTNYAWQTDSMAVGYWVNPMVTVDWLVEMQSYAVVPKVSLGVSEVQAAGIVKITCDETK